MIPDNLHDFLLASVGASASFIGLLFVALTLVLGRQEAGSVLAGRDRVLANSSYTALITIFFISMVGLIPESNVAWVMIAMGWLGVLSSLQLARLERADGQRNDNKVIGSILILLYIALALFGIYAVTNADKHIDAEALLGILFALYITALTRAWSLIGADIEKPNRTRKQ